MISTDTMDRQSSVWQKLEDPDGQMSCEVNIPTGAGYVEEEAGLARVSCSSIWGVQY